MVRYPLQDITKGAPIGLFQVAEVYPEGRGGMARVVRAQMRTRRNQHVALKISRVGANQNYFSAALQKEVEILSQLSHKGVVRLAEVSNGKNPFKERAIEIDGSPWYFGMECLYGGTLEAYLRALGPLTLRESAAICFQVGQALSYIHAQGFSHNDVKPDNILFRRELIVGGLIDPVLIDFGVATRMVRQQPDGSVVYMAPERLQESKDPSAPEIREQADPAKADVWSMGILLYRLLTGREPFLGVTDRSVTSAIMRAMPDPVSSRRGDIPRQIDEFIREGCLAKTPELRVSMADFIQVMDRYSGDWRLQRVPQKKKSSLLSWLRG
jgi:serine/threonine-protein kinase